MRKVGITMIIPPWRMYVCLGGASSPEKAFWIPESGANMNYSASWGGNLLFRGNSCHPQGSILSYQNDCCFWTMMGTLTEPALLFAWLHRELKSWLHLLPSSACTVVDGEMFSLLEEAVTTLCRIHKELGQLTTELHSFKLLGDGFSLRKVDKRTENICTFVFLREVKNELLLRRY